MPAATSNAALGVRARDDSSAQTARGKLFPRSLRSGRFANARVVDDGVSRGWTRQAKVRSLDVLCGLVAPRCRRSTIKIARRFTAYVSAFEYTEFAVSPPRVSGGTQIRLTVSVLSRTEKSYSVEVSGKLSSAVPVFARTPIPGGRVGGARRWDRRWQRWISIAPGSDATNSDFLFQHPVDATDVVL